LGALFLKSTARCKIFLWKKKELTPYGKSGKKKHAIMCDNKKYNLLFFNILFYKKP